jgi:hypothetical protein
MKKIIYAVFAVLSLASCKKLTDIPFDKLKGHPHANQVDITIEQSRGNQFYEIRSETINSQGDFFEGPCEYQPTTYTECDVMLTYNDPNDFGLPKGNITIAVQLQPAPKSETEYFYQSNGTGTWYFKEANGIYKDIKKGGGKLTYTWTKDKGDLPYTVITCI